MFVAIVILLNCISAAISMYNALNDTIVITSWAIAAANLTCIAVALIVNRKK